MQSALLRPLIVLYRPRAPCGESEVRKFGNKDAMNCHVTDDVFGDITSCQPIGGLGKDTDFDAKAQFYLYPITIY